MKMINNKSGLSEKALATKRLYDDLAVLEGGMTRNPDYDSYKREKAEMVIAFCGARSVPNTLSVSQLLAGMGQLQYIAQSALDMLDFIHAYEAAKNAK